MSVVDLSGARNKKQRMEIGEEAIGLARKHIAIYNECEEREQIILKSIAALDMLEFLAKHFSDELN